MTRIFRTKTILGGALSDVASRMFKIEVRIRMASASWASSAVESREEETGAGGQLSLRGAYSSGISTELQGHLAS